MDKIYLELGTFEKYASAVMRTVGKRILSSHDHFFESAAKTNSACNLLKIKVSLESTAGFHMMSLKFKLQNY